MLILLQQLFLPIASTIVVAITKTVQISNRTNVALRSDHYCIQFTCKLIIYPPSHFTILRVHVATYNQMLILLKITSIRYRFSVLILTFISVERHLKKKIVKCMNLCNENVSKLFGYKPASPLSPPSFLLAIEKCVPVYQCASMSIQSNNIFDYQNIHMSVRACVRVKIALRRTDRTVR